MRFISAFTLTQIGGAGAGNTIAFNAGNGINFDTANIGAVQNRIANNSIFSNGSLGIDLGGDGITANDECDGENGVNNLQNYPVISAVNLSGAGNVRIVGRLNTAANLTYTLSFYANQVADPSGFGEGQQFIGMTNVSVPAGCQANFNATLPRTLATARCISATATDPDGNTSEFSSCVAIKAATGDFDSDGLADLAIFRPSVGEWWINRSSSGQTVAAQFGGATDKPVPADFTGDGKIDIAIWRPSTGEWFVLRSEDGSFFSVPFGAAGDIPVPGDYDGDGKSDPTVFRPSSSIWYINRTSAGISIVNFGITGDIPVSNVFVP